MSQLPIYILDPQILPELKVRLRRVSLIVEETSVPKNREEATETNWKCSDESGDLFYFSMCEAKEKNALGLGMAVGTCFLLAGPPAPKRTRKETSVAWKALDSTLLDLGARPYQVR